MSRSRKSVESSTTVHSTFVIFNAVSFKNTQRFNVDVNFIIQFRAKLISTHDSVIIDERCIIVEKIVLKFQSKTIVDDNEIVIESETTIESNVEKNNLMRETSK